MLVKRWKSLLSRWQDYRVEQGQLFAMLTLDSSVQVFGVIEVPADAPHECLVRADIGKHLSLELSKPKAPNGYGGCCDMSNLWKYDMPGLMTYLNFIHYQCENQFDVYVRRSHLEHEEPTKRWAVIAGMAQIGLTSNVMEGMHDIRPAGMSFSKTQPQIDPFKTPSSFFSEKLWGRDGSRELTSTLHVSTG